MREILFRGKTTDRDWTYGYYVFTPKRTGAFGQVVTCSDFDRHYILTMKFNIVKEVIPETVGQYTGLTDKNGNKIFEGDIIKTDNGRVSAILVVQYGKFEPRMFYDLIEVYVIPRPKEKLYGLFAKSENGEEVFLSECSHLIEVIGNIHDNPELLKGGEG